MNLEIEEIFKQMKLSIPLFPSKNKKTFNTIEDFFFFLSKELAFWAPCTDGHIRRIADHFRSIESDINGFRHINNTNEMNLSELNNHLQRIVRNASINSDPCIFSSTPTAKFLKDLYSNNPHEANGAYGFLFANSLQISNVYNFKGTLDAYQFENKINLLAQSERKSFDELYQESFNKLESLSTEFYSKKEQVDKDYNIVKEIMATEHTDFKNKIDSLVDISTQRINDLEKLYTEKLRLEAPAHYWKNMHKDYLGRGEKWKHWAVGASIIFIIFLACLLYYAPSALFEEYGLNSVKATIIFALIASIGIYIIRLLVTLSTSAYHLSRDAYERYQLTHVYLSLLKDEGVKDEERAIVLQSIFSRADTGLLKKDGSPSFPNGSLESILKNLRS
ncbi:MAG: DUF6161 domain-containing protein [Proteocatella sp.]